MSVHELQLLPSAAERTLRRMDRFSFIEQLPDGELRGMMDRLEQIKDREALSCTVAHLNLKRLVWAVEDLLAAELTRRADDIA